MKRLILMRHADAQPLAFSKNDRERSLSLQGLQEIEIIRKKLQGRVSSLTFVLCSNTKRARQTLEGIKPLFPSKVEIVFDDRIYHAPPEVLKECLREIDPKHETVLLLGHNPGISQILELSLQAAHQIDIASYVSTATAVIFDIPLDKWKLLKVSLMTVQTILRPKEE